jgi:protein-L-isoaspartate(D-aspartate) O-methyltransferase
MDNDYYYDTQELTSIEQQKKELLTRLKQNSINNEQVIKAISKVPREEFISKNLKKYAYENMPLSIGYEQTISSPEIVAYMVQEAHLTKENQVLEIGTGSGYQTAILSLLCDKVFSIEIIPELAESAKKVLKKLGYYTDKNNIEIQIGSGYLTKYKNNSFDAIIVTAAPTTVPEHLKKLLEINGRLIIPVGDGLYQQELLRITKHENNKFTEERLLDVRFVPMVKS